MESLIEDPLFQYRVRLSRAGDVLRGEFWVEPGGGGAIEHIHPPIEERFEVLEGEITYHAGRVNGQAGPGDRFTVPAGARHRFINTGQGLAHVIVDMEPAFDMQELFADAAALGRAGKWTRVGKRGIPTGPRAVLDMAEFLDRYRKIFIVPFPPLILQRTSVPALARLARRRKRTTAEAST
jgi:mannose-6-phosphate isomerase-like protein (cupin superfamily)